MTKKQRQLIQFIRSFIEEKKFAPTIREMADHMGVKSASSISAMLGRLEYKGLITRPGGKARTISLNQDCEKSNVIRLPAFRYLFVLTPEGESKPCYIGTAVDPVEAAEKIMVYSPVPLEISFRFKIKTLAGAIAVQKKLLEIYQSKRLHGSWLYLELADVKRAISTLGTAKNAVFGRKAI